MIRIFTLSLLIFLISCASTQTNFRNTYYGKVTETKVTARVLHGEASYYAEKYHGRQTANGEIFDMNALTCAHKSLPFNTKLRVTYLKTGKSVIVRVNDRGPFIGDRILDLSKQAAKEIGLIEEGVGNVKIEIL